MLKNLHFLLIIIFFFNISSCARNNYLIFETSPNDLSKSCPQIGSELQDLESNALRRAKRSQKIQDVENVGLIIIAIPTVFISLLFLDFSDKTDVKAQKIRNRIHALIQLQEFKDCNS